MLSNDGESDDFMKVRAFQTYFDQIGQGLNGLSLANKGDNTKSKSISKSGKSDHLSGADKNKKPSSSKPKPPGKSE